MNTDYTYSDITELIIIPYICTCFFFFLGLLLLMMMMFFDVNFFFFLNEHLHIHIWCSNEGVLVFYILSNVFNVCDSGIYVVMNLNGKSE